MKSMTGFGYSEYQDESLHFTVEIKSYNNRYLDLFINLPPFLSPLEGNIREFLGRRIGRGRVEVYIKMRELQEDVEVILDEKVVRNYVSVLRRLSALAELDETVLLSDLLRMEGVIKLERNRNVDTYWEMIEPQLAAAFDQFEQARIREGEHTREDIFRCIGEIRDGLKIISDHAGELEARIRENLQQRFSEAMGNEIDEKRILAETAVMLVKYSINEEIIRLRGHLDAFEEGSEGPGLKGKKLDFLCQELNREINTIGSKSFILEVNQAVILVKDAIEKLREQLRNIE